MPRHGAEPLELSHGELSLTLLPALGGSVARCRWRDTDLLRSALPGAADPRDTAAFPMVPFAGRIDRGRFRYDARAVQLPANMPPEAHAIHGFGWQGRWHGERLAANAARLHWHHAGDRWPWRCRATQQFQLDDRGLALTLSLENRDRAPMPAGFGWHPYFPSAGATLAVALDSSWPHGEDMIPRAPEPLAQPFTPEAPRAVAALSLDDVFDWPDRQLTLAWPARGVALRLSGDAVLDRLVLYTPPGTGFFCAEPLSHVPNAVNSPLAAQRTGLRLLQPGEVLVATLRLQPEILS